MAAMLEGITVDLRRLCQPQTNQKREEKGGDEAGRFCLYCRVTVYPSTKCRLSFYVNLCALMSDFQISFSFYRQFAHTVYIFCYKAKH
jgi:hypothetical protein